MRVFDVQIELVTPRHEPNYEMRTLRIPSLHAVSTVAGHLWRQDGNVTSVCVCVCEQTAIRAATDMWHIIMNAQVSGHFIGYS